MPDGTTIVGCACPGDNTDRICAYQIKGGKAVTARTQILNKWCVPSKAAERATLPKGIEKSAEINLALSADRSSFYLSYNDYYQNFIDVVYKHPKWFQISLFGPYGSQWEQMANGTLITHTVGAAVVFGAIPVSQVSRHSQEHVCCCAL
jgi:hypothetical protein